jgi:hypothetical protein
MKVAYIILAFIILTICLFIGGCEVGKKMKEDEYLKASIDNNKESEMSNEQASIIDNNDFHINPCVK